MTDVIYTLKHPFQYTSGGDVVDASFITITAPNYKQLQHAVPIKQAFAAAISEISVSDADREKAEQSKDESEQIQPEQAMQLIYASSRDATKTLLYAAELFKAGAALIDGETKITAPLLDKMSGEDFEGLVGAYLVNFIVPSLTGGTKESKGRKSAS